MMGNSNKDIPVAEISNNNYKSIREWREDDRPRERLVKNGAASLSDSELLAILISSGTKNFSALDIAKTLLDKYESVSNLATCDYSEFKNIKGLGFARAITLTAAFELAKRVGMRPFTGKSVMRTPEDIANHYIPRFLGARKETFHTLLLNSANHVFRDVVISEGILNASIVHPREVFRIAITESAASVILLHNHPSNSTEPSLEDINITKQLVEAGKLIEIKVLDHIIIAGNSFTSMARRGFVKFY